MVGKSWVALVVGYGMCVVSHSWSRLRTTSLLLLFCYEGFTAGHVLLDEGVAFARDGLGEFLPLLFGHVGQGHCESGDGDYK